MRKVGHVAAKVESNQLTRSLSCTYLTIYVAVVGLFRLDDNTGEFRPLQQYQSVDPTIESANNMQSTCTICGTQQGRLQPPFVHPPKYTHPSTPPSRGTAPPYHALPGERKRKEKTYRLPHYERRKAHDK